MYGRIAILTKEGGSKPRATVVLARTVNILYTIVDFVLLFVLVLILIFQT